MRSHYIEWEPRRKKDGTPSKRGDIRYVYFETLQTCELCGRIGTSRRVTSRSDLYDQWLMELRRYEPLRLCVACWNRIRPIFKQLRELAELRKIAKRMVRGIF